MTAHGAFHWNELNTRNVKKAKDFYAKTLGWTFEDAPMGEGMTYTTFYSNGQMAGGIFEMKGPMFENVLEHWLPYIAVDDIDKTVAWFRRHGAAARLGARRGALRRGVRVAALRRRAVMRRRRFRLSCVGFRSQARV